MKRLVTALCLVGAATAFTSAQRHDIHDRAAAGTGVLPAGWMTRLDSGALKATGITIMQVNGGLHIRSGPAGVYYRTADRKAGTYQVQATFAEHAGRFPEAYGLFVGGSGLDGATPKYTYFLIRMDGRYLIKRRMGEQTPTLVNWTDNAAVRRATPDGKVSNTLSIIVAADKVRFLANGTEVGSLPASQVDVMGIAGLRINHDLNVQVQNFSVK